jgi:hypothetical protein
VSGTLKSQVDDAWQTAVVSHYILWAAATTG